MNLTRVSDSCPSSHENHALKNSAAAVSLGCLHAVLRVFARARVQWSSSLHALVCVFKALGHTCGVLRQVNALKWTSSEIAVFVRLLIAQYSPVRGFRFRF